MSPLHRLAAAAGLSVEWEDAQGTPRVVDEAALKAILTALGRPCDTDQACLDSLADPSLQPRPALITCTVGQLCRVPLAGPVARLHLEGDAVRTVTLAGEPGERMFLAAWPMGRHRLEDGETEVTIAICPTRARTARDALGRKGWGLTAQVYALRETPADAFGDFGALADLATRAAYAGADALAISPVHALFSSDPERYSPYSPSSRDRLNPLYADVPPTPHAGELVAGAPLIDWAAAAVSKRNDLRAAWAGFAGDPAFDRFIAEGGALLRDHAVFDALDAHFKARGGRTGWTAWSKPYQDPAADVVADFAGSHLEEIRFHLFCQWRADADLARAHQAARDGGMGLGLIADLAVGLDPGGSHAWSRRDDLLAGLTIGAPPDAFQSAGQGWGLTTFSPAALARTGYAPFLRTVRSALRHAGGIRIDHALGLNRLWVIPEGASPLDGAYLRNPFDDLLNLLALESSRAGAVIIGEDLGVVPEGVRDRLETRGALGMRVLPFERDGSGAFLPPGDWTSRAVALTTTHDLPPIAGWWRGRDIEWRERLGAEGDRDAERRERVDARDRFWTLAVSEGAAVGSAPEPDRPGRAVDAAIALTARSACELALIPLEDLLGLDEAVNLPGVVDVHPNWRRRLPVALDKLFDDPAVMRRIERLKTERP